MPWAKVTDRETGAFHYSATPNAYDDEVVDVLPLADDRCPMGLEEVDEFGNIFVPIEARQAQLWEQVKVKRAERKAAGTALSGVGTVQTDDVSTANITGLVVMAQVAIAQGQPFSEPFTMADNSVVTFDAPGMIGMGVGVAQYVAAVYARGRALREAIFAPDATLEQLDAIDVGAGWP